MAPSSKAQKAKPQNADNTGAEEISLYDSIVAACNLQEIMALPIKIGPCMMSLAVDTGATVSILSEEAYMALKRNDRGGRWPFRYSELNSLGVTGS